MSGSYFAFPTSGYVTATGPLLIEALWALQCASLSGWSQHFLIVSHAVTRFWEVPLCTAELLLVCIPQAKGKGQLLCCPCSLPCDLWMFLRGQSCTLVFPSTL